MANDDVHVGDFGTIVRGTIKDEGVVVDVSAATTKQLIFRKADGTTVAKDADFTTDGTDGQIQYTIEADFLNVAGHWAYQGHVTTGGSPLTGGWKSDIHAFVVHPNL